MRGWSSDVCSSDLLVLGEIARVARMVVIKDHLRDGLAAGPTLRFMDWVGNAAHGVRLPYNYLSHREWQARWAKLDLGASAFVTRLSLYPRPFGADERRVGKEGVRTGYIRGA